MAEQEKPKPDRPNIASSVGMTLFVLLGLVGCLLICLPVSFIGAYLTVHPEALKPVDPDPPVEKEDPARPNFAKADLDKVEAGMSLDEVNRTLGPGKAASPDDMARAFGDAGQGAAARWQESGKAAGVTLWHQWRTGDDSLFVGFARGKRSGKDRAITSFWVQRQANGFKSDFGLLPLPNDPDTLAEERERRLKNLNDPKFKGGDAKKLLVGRWYDEVKHGYEFKADGTYTRLRDTTFSSTYRFLAADQIELTIPAGAIFVGGKEMKESHKVWISDDELILQQIPGQLQLKYRRAN